MLEYWYGKFSSQAFSHVNTPTFPNLDILHIYLPMEIEQSVPKRRNIKFRRRGITQNKAHNIQNMAKVWNQELRQSLRIYILNGHLV